MPEVIELLSSSPLPSKPSLQKKAGPVVSTNSLLDGLSDFDDTGSIDFQIDRPKKRQRLSPAPKLGSKSTTSFGFNFSSDPPSDDVFCEAKQTITLLESQPTKQVDVRSGDIGAFTFSSSAPEPIRIGASSKPSARDSGTHVLKTFLDGDDDIQELPGPSSQPDYNHRTANLLASLSQTRDPKLKAGESGLGAKTFRTSGVSRTVDEIEYSSSPVKTRITKHGKLTEAEKTARADARASQRAVQKEHKEAAKGAEREKKRLEREHKAKEKQKAADLAEANKSKTNKKDAAPEMILDISNSLKGTSLGNQVEQRMGNVQVEVNYIDEEIDLADGDEQEQYGSVVTWRRKVKSTYNEENDQWEPTSGTRIEKEKHVLIYLPAGDFAAVAAARRTPSGLRVSRTVEEMKSNIDAHVSSIRRRFGACVMVYLLEGLRSWLKQQQNAKNREYAAGVRAQMMQNAAVDSASASSQARSRKRKKPGSESLDLAHVTTEIVDDLLLHLQIAHQPILIHHTPTPTDSASQISALTQHLSTRPYRKAQLDLNLKSASFCMDSGQVKTGEDARETFVKMLQEIQRVTPSMAYGILEEHKSVRKLVKGFEKHGNLLLADVRKTVNANGGYADKRLGPQVSKRLFKVFMGRDPTATDGMS